MGLIKMTAQQFCDRYPALKERQCSDLPLHKKEWNGPTLLEFDEEAMAATHAAELLEREAVPDHWAERIAYEVESAINNHPGVAGVCVESVTRHGGELTIKAKIKLAVPADVITLNFDLPSGHSLSDEDVAKILREVDDG